MTTPDDPGAIDLDLDAAKKFSRHELLRAYNEIGVLPAINVTASEYLDLLIAAVEALRARVAVLELKSDRAIKWERFYRNKTEAAEAHGVELARALKELLREHECLLISIGKANARVSIWHKKARIALAATPADALERAKAVENVIDVCRKFKQFVEAGQILTIVTRCEKLLGELDALGEEQSE